MSVINKILVNSVEYELEDTTARSGVATNKTSIDGIASAVSTVRTDISNVYTKAEVNTALEAKADTTHSHVLSEITDARHITCGTAAPSGGSSGDIYIKYV